MVVDINEELIATVTGLPMVGHKFYKDKKSNEEVMTQFFKDNEWKKLIKMESWGYERKSLKKVWANIAEVIMWYVNLEDRFTKILGHHFTLLNHFRHGLLISFPFFLLSSMEVSIYVHLKNRRALVLHEGLIILIMEHFRSLVPAPAIKGKEKILSKASGLDTSCDQ